MSCVGCQTSKYLSQDQSLLKKNDLNLKTDVGPDEKAALKFELETFYRQKPNSKFFVLFPSEWFYLVNEGDSSWYNNWSRNWIGEKPSYFLESKTAETAESMKNFLRNKKGFYNAEVDYTVNTSKKKTRVKYNIKTNEQYKIASVEYIGEDQALVNLIKNLDSPSLLKKDGPIDYVVFDQEKNRISTELQNLGYANFVPNYITIKGDSTNQKNAIDIFVEINNPGLNERHKRYRIGDINIYTDYYQGQNTQNTISDEIHGLIFKREIKKFIVKPSRLNQKTFLRKNDLYRREAQSKTYQKLSSLDFYRFITINPSVSTVSDTIIDINIFLTPHEKKWISDSGINLFYSTISAAGRRLFGFSVGGSLENRNIFGGAERLTIEGEIGYEFDFSPKVRTSAITGNFQANLKVPKVFDPVRTIGLMNKIGIVGDNRYQTFKEETTTNIALGYNITNIIDYYDLRTVSTSFGYDYKPNPRHNYLIRSTGLDYNSAALESNFLLRISNNPLILKSFESNVLTGFLFKNLTYVYQSNKNKSGFSWANITNIELSGWEILLANKLLDPDNIWQFNSDIQYSKFVKLEFDNRWYKDIGEKSSFASRLAVGAAFPLAKDQEIPFIKQFYVGGPNSIRAWQLRELGPGGYADKLKNPVPNELFFQQGDLKLEFSLEYRFDVIWYLEGAFFLDGGNIWTRNEDLARPGSNFTRNFYNDIAMGVGWGLRWDFSYFNIRFDFGYPIRNPFPNEQTGSHWLPPSTFKFLGNVNIAVNYPF